MPGSHDGRPLWPSALTAYTANPHTGYLGTSRDTLEFVLTAFLSSSTAVAFLFDQTRTNIGPLLFLLTTAA